MNNETQGLCFLKNFKGLFIFVIPNNMILKTNSCSIFVNFCQVKGLNFKNQIVNRELSPFRPIFYRLKVKGMKVDGTDCCRFINSIYIIFLQSLKDSLGNLYTIHVPIHLPIFRLYQYSSQPSIGISFSFMKFIKINDHLYDIIQGWESELEIEYFIPCGVLILPNAKALEFCKGEVVSPPIAFLLQFKKSSFFPICELSPIFNLCQSCQKRIMHHQRVFLFCEDDIKLDKVSSLIESSLKCLQGIFGKK